MDIQEFIAGILIAAGMFGAGTMAANHRQKKEYTVANVYYVDVNADKRQDIVMKNKAGNLVIFLQNQDGKYLSVEDYLSQEKDEVTSRGLQIERTARDYVKSETGGRE